MRARAAGRVWMGSGVEVIRDPGRVPGRKVKVKL
jgi:hypothetical protein